MTRPAKIALIVSGAVLACVLASCGVALALRDWVPGLAGCDDDLDGPTKTAVITTTIRIEQMWPQLAPIQEVHWQEREARARSCPEIGPMDYVMDGFALLTPEVTAALTASEPAAPGAIPEDLRAFAPANPDWRRVDAATGPGIDAGSAQRLLLDRASRVAYFTRSTM